MGSENLILHQYDISPFSQKAQKMMALKGLSWLSIEMPMIAPKPDVEALTGGYRGTPVLQIGADVFIDNWMIARAIDQFAPDRPPINARGALGDAALYAWGERLFIPLLHSALATYKGRWDANFLADRKQVFPDVDFDTLEVGDLDRCSQVRDLVPIVEAFPAFVAWYQRVEALGIGAREDVTMEVAWDALRNGQTQRLPDTPVEEPLNDWLGHAVHISAGSADRGSVAGRLLAVDHEQAVLAVEPLSGFEAQVWFPRFGYHLSKGAC
jgi:glutathione S-transferase